MIEYENLAKLNAPFMAEYEASFRRTLESGWFILGKNVETFEKEFASYIGTKHCIGVASGLDALLLPLKALELPQGSEVLVPSNTYVATILAILQAGLRPILVEPDLSTYNIDPQRAEKARTSNTRAVLIVHLYGKSCDMQPLVEMCNRRGLHLIEDCAQSHGATYRQKKTGSFGIGAFSFYPTKNLGALGDAGAITCDSDEMAIKLRTLRNYGSRIKYHNEVLGYNSRLDEVQAGFLSIKLRSLDEINAHKRKLARVYFENLPKELLTLPSVDPDFFDVFHIFNVRTKDRDGLRQHLLDSGIKTEIHYPVPPHQQRALKNLFSGSEYPLSEEIHQTTLSLPISTFHKEEDVYQVATKIKAYLQR